jgi:hypothetical protein
MKIKKGFILREMNDMNIVVAVGDAAKEFNGIITLNSTAVFMWKELENGCTQDELVSSLTSAYSVDKEKAAEDVKKFVKKLKDAELIDE